MCNGPPTKTRAILNSCLSRRHQILIDDQMSYQLDSINNSYDGLKKQRELSLSLLGDLDVTS